MLDAGALHLYDAAGDFDGLPALLDGAAAIARARFAGVLAAAAYADDPFGAALRAGGFELDEVEADVRAGRPIALHRFVRALE